MPAKGQKITDPEVLDRLKRMREKANETLKKKREITQAKRDERKQNLEREYEEKVLKKKTQPIIEETDKDIYPTTITPPPQQSESDNDEVNDVLPSKPNRKTNKVCETQAETNYKQLYYKAKLDSISSQQQQKQQEQQFFNQYSQLPPQQHAIDIAQQALKTKANKAVYESVYRSLFNL